MDRRHATWKSRKGPLSGLGLEGAVERARGWDRQEVIIIALLTIGRSRSRLRFGLHRLAECLIKRRVELLLLPHTLLLRGSPIIRRQLLPDLHSELLLLGALRRLDRLQLHPHLVMLLLELGLLKRVHASDGRNAPRLGRVEVSMRAAVGGGGSLINRA